MEGKPLISGASIRRDNLYSQIAGQIEQLIMDQQLVPGDKLNAERELAALLGVSRTVVREAVRVLSDRGLLVVKPGSGTFVSRPSSSSTTDTIGRYLTMHGAGMNYRDLSEVRRTLEVEIAGIASQRRTPEDLSALNEIMERLSSSIAAEEEFVHADLDFHMALAEATHNPLFRILLSPIQTLLLRFRLDAIHVDPDRSVSGALLYHRRILEAVEEQDAQRARSAMEQHIKQGLQVVEE